MSRIQQLYCTHCTYGSSALEQRDGPLATRPLGYSVRAGSLRKKDGALDRDELRRYFREAERFMSFYLPSDAPADARLQLTAATAQRRLVYCPSLNGYRLVTQVSYRQVDTAGRPGSYFAHALMWREADGGPSATACAQTWGARWQEADSPNMRMELEPLAGLDALRNGAPPAVSDDVLASFLTTPAGGVFNDPGNVIPPRWRNEPADRRAALVTTILQSLVNLGSKRREPLVTVVEPSVAALVFYGVLRMLPPGPLRDGTGFSTYESHPERSMVALTATSFYSDKTDLRPEAYRGRGFVYHTWTGKTSSVDTSGKYAALVMKKFAAEGWKAVDDLLADFAASGASSLDDLERIAAAQTGSAAVFELSAPMPTIDWNDNLAVNIYRASARNRLALGVDKCFNPPGAPPPVDRIFQVLQLTADEQTASDEYPSGPEAELKARVRSGVEALLAKLTPESLDTLLGAERVALRYRLRALRNYVDSHGKLPVHCERMWEDAKPRPGRKADYVPVLVKLLADVPGDKLKELQASVPPERTELYVDVLVQVYRQKPDHYPVLSAAIDKLDEAQLPAFAARNKSVLKTLPERDAFFEWLRKYLHEIPMHPAEFNTRLDFLMDWEDKLPKSEGNEAPLHHWRHIRQGFQAVAARSDTPKKQFSAAVGKWIGLGDAQENDLDHEAWMLANHLQLAMPKTQYPDIDGDVKESVFKSLARTLLGGRESFSRLTLSRLKGYFRNHGKTKREWEQRKIGTLGGYGGSSAGNRRLVVMGGGAFLVGCLLMWLFMGGGGGEDETNPGDTAGAATTGETAGTTGDSTATTGATSGGTSTSDVSTGTTDTGKPKTPGDATPGTGTGAPPPAVDPMLEQRWRARIADLRAKRTALDDRLQNTAELSKAQAAIEMAFKTLSDLSSPIAGLREQVAAGAKPDRDTVQAHADEFASAQRNFENNLVELRKQSAASASVVDPLVTDMDAVLKAIQQAQIELKAPVPDLRERQEELNAISNEAKARLDELKKLQLPPTRFDTKYAELAAEAKKNLDDLAKLASAMDPLPALMTADGKGLYEVSLAFGLSDTRRPQPFQTSNSAQIPIWSITWKVPPEKFVLRLHRPKDAAAGTLAAIALQRFDRLDGTDAEKSIGVLFARLSVDTKTEAQFRLRKDGASWSIVLNWNGHSGTADEPNSVYTALSQCVLEFWTPDGSWYIVFHPVYTPPAVVKDQTKPGDKSGVLRFQQGPEQKRQASELKLAGGEITFDKIEPIVRDTVRPLPPPPSPPPPPPSPKPTGTKDSTPDADQKPREDPKPGKKLETNPNFRWEIAKPEMGVFSILRMENGFSIIGLADAACIPARSDFPVFVSIPTTVWYDGFREEKKQVQATDINGQPAVRQTTVPDPTPRNPKNTKTVYVPIMNTVIEKIPTRLPKPGDPEIKEMKQPRPAITLSEALLTVGYEPTPNGSGSTLITFTPHITATVQWPGGAAPPLHPPPSDGSPPKPEDRAQDLMTNLANDQAPKLPTWIKGAVNSFSGVLYYELDDGTPIEYIRIGTTKEPIALPLKPTAPLPPPEQTTAAGNQPAPAATTTTTSPPPAVSASATPPMPPASTTSTEPAAEPTTIAPAAVSPAPAESTGSAAGT